MFSSRIADAQRQFVKKPTFIYQIYQKNSCIKDLIFVNLNMQHITTISRRELNMSSLEDKIGTLNPLAIPSQNFSITP